MRDEQASVRRRKFALSTWLEGEVVLEVELELVLEVELELVLCAAGLVPLVAVALVGDRISRNVVVDSPSSCSRRSWRRAPGSRRWRPGVKVPTILVARVSEALVMRPRAQP